MGNVSDLWFLRSNIEILLPTGESTVLPSGENVRLPVRYTVPYKLEKLYENFILPPSPGEFWKTRITGWKKLCDSISRLGILDLWMFQSQVKDFKLQRSIFYTPPLNMLVGKNIHFKNWGLEKIWFSCKI